MQNVGTPRFYVDILQWLKSQGLLSLNASSFTNDNLMDLIGVNPSEQLTFTGGDGWKDVIRFNTSSPLKDLMPNDKNFAMYLGHNLKTANAKVYIQEGEGTVNPEEVASTYSSVAQGLLVNYNNANDVDYDGFSISIGNDADDMQTDLLQFRFDNVESTENDTVDYPTPIKMGSLLYGTYYDMPHSPDLNLKLRYEYDGVKTVQTKGGATLSNALYTKPADWGDIGAWQLGTTETPNPSNFRTGRRVWDLSFSYLNDSDIMPNLGVQNYEVGETAEDILDGTDFFSQVWNRTIGGHLPFIFNPSGGGTSPNNNPDQFAICRFDMDSLQYDQVANNVYNVKLRIREVW